jgi:pyrroline-5-carboxylate reductase
MNSDLPPLFFLGAGRMAGAMVRGLLAAGAIPPDQVVCSGGRGLSAEALAAETGIRREADPLVALAASEVLVLACKPHQLDELPPELASATAGKLVVSVLAGIPLDRLRQLAPEARNLVRTMPNTPSRIGEGMTAYAMDRPLTSYDEGIVRALLEPLGKVLPIAESHLDAVTAVSGSGPAYVFEFTRALAAAGESLGLEPADAARLARQTVIGAAGLLAQRSGSSAAELRDEVASPGGTTEAGLHALEEAGLEEALRRTATAARDRSRELSGR